MTADHKASVLLERWTKILRDREVVSRGLIVDDMPCPFDRDLAWLPNELRVWNPTIQPTPPDSFDLLVLRDLDPKLLSDDGDRTKATESAGRLLLRAATTAVRRGVPILAHTSSRFGALKQPATTPVSPFKLDVTRLLAFEELVYLLQVHCELVVETIDPSATAQYLTPIERRLADALTQAEIPFAAQVSIGRYIVDFMIDENLVVECDGESWHDPEKDESRDRDLRDLGVKVVRFTGRAIHRDVRACVERVRLEQKSSTERIYSPSIKMTFAQQRAASHIDGPAMVVAPAGSGKTRVIEERVRWLIASGVDQSRICVLSFTNAAVGEVKDRLEAFPYVAVRTLSSFGNEIVRARFGKLTMIENQRDPRIMTPIQILQHVARRVGYSPPSRTGAWVVLRDAIMNYRGSFVVPEQGELGISLSKDTDESEEEHYERCVDMFLRIHDAYEDVLNERNLQDFNRQIIDAIRILSSDFERRLEVSESYDYWLIDEFQDLAPPKILLARLLASPARNLMVVGDDDQIIYGFAGAQPQSFGALDRDWCDVTALPLDINFRSPHEIVVRSRWLIERNQMRIPKNTVPHRILDAVDCVEVSPEDSADYATRAVNAFSEIRKTRPADDVVFLFRTSMAAAPVEFLLTQKNIPFVPLAKSSLIHNPVAKWIISWLAVVNEQSVTPDDWKSVLEKPTRYLTKETIAWVVGAQDPFQRICHAGEAGGGNIVGVSAKQRVSGVSDQFRQLRRTIEAARRFPDSLESQLRQLGLRDVLVSDAQRFEKESSGLGAKPQGDGRSVDPLVVHDIVALLATLSGTWTSLRQFLVRAQSDPDIDLNEPSDLGDSPDALRLKTIHSFKGRECPIVFVLGPQQGAMPDSRAIDIFELEEERRVAYVAATRAKERLYFWCSALYESELSAREDGLTWEMYRAGLTVPPVEEPPTPMPIPPPERPKTLLEAPPPVRQSEPGLLVLALKWVMSWLSK